MLYLAGKIITRNRISILAQNIMSTPGEIWKEVSVEWKGGNSFLGTTPDGSTVQIGSLEGNPGASPMELLLMGLAGCTGIDVAGILVKKRQPLADLKIEVRGKRRESHPRVYTHIEIIYLLWGDGLDVNAVEQAIRLSEEKYCSASAMLGATAEISTSYRLLS